MKGAMVAEDGRAHASIRRLTPTHDVVGALVELFRELRAAATAGGLRVVGAGVVTPGVVDEEAGVVRYASNLGWRDLPLHDLLSAQLGMPVAVGHDVRAAGLAERLLGAARGYDDFVLVPIGTGVAATLFSAGRTLTGAGGAAGEFGHIPVYPGGELCTCGQHGCLEVYVSGAGLARRYAARGGRSLTAEQIVARLGADSIADEVWRDAVDALGYGLVTMTLLMDPMAIVLGGGFVASGDALLTPLRRALARGLAWREAPPVLLSSLGGSAARTGAAVLAYRNAGLGSVVDAWALEAHVRSAE
ncbi:MAG: ROK family protein [Microbacteriaceae bacterium]|nr:MAG: ROK family protein [Microbacteriaceae bacterium]